MKETKAYLQDSSWLFEETFRRRDRQLYQEEVEAFQKEITCTGSTIPRIRLIDELLKSSN